MTSTVDWDDLDRVLRGLGLSVLKQGQAFGLPWALVPPAAWLPSATFLSDAAFTLFVDVTAVDLQRAGAPAAERFVVQLILGQAANRIGLRVRLGLTDPVLPSVAALWPGATWFEREVFDMYGVRFTAHPDLRRILLYPEFVGHPLRKDYAKLHRQPLVRVGPLSRGSGKGGAG